MSSHDSGIKTPVESGPLLSNSTAQTRSRWRKFCYPVLDGLSVALVALLCVNAFSAFNHNDFMYAVAPTLLGEFALYDELGFVQAPGSIWLYNLIFQYVAPIDFYVSLRAFSLFLLISAGFLIFQTANKVVGRPAAYLVPILLCTSPIVLSVAEEIGNTSLALFFLSAAVFVYFTKPQSLISSAAIGLLIGLSAAAKLNFSLYAFAFGILFTLDRSLLSRHVLTYCVAGIIGSVQIWYYLATAPTEFWFFNIDFHYLTNQWRGTETSTGLAAAGAIARTFVWTSLPQLTLCSLAFLLSRKIDRNFKIPGAVALLLTSLVAAAMPLFYAKQYLAPSTFILALLTAIAARVFAIRLSDKKYRYWTAVLGVALFVATSNGVLQARKSMHAYGENRVGPLAMRAISVRIDEKYSQYLKGTTCSKTAISISSQPLIGTSFSISTFGATGPFLARIAPQIERHMPSFSHHADVGKAIRQSAPTAFLVGLYPDIAVENEIWRYATQAGFKAFPVGSVQVPGTPRSARELILLIRESCIVTN